MELTPYQEDVFAGKICPYCKSGVRVTTETEVYGREYKGRKVICCKNYPTCDAYVGTHEEDGTALGRLANNELRQYKKVAHSWFDRIWKEDHMNRKEAYEWLSEVIGTPRNYTHIGMFNIATCKKVIAVCTKYLENDNHRSS